MVQELKMVRNILILITTVCKLTRVTYSSLLRALPGYNSEAFTQHVVRCFYWPSTNANLLVAKITALHSYEKTATFY